MESTHNEKVQKLQKQLDEANQELQRSLDLIQEMKIEKERLTIENYSLIRQMAIQKNRYDEIKIRAASVFQSASHLQKIVNELLPEFWLQKSNPSLQVQSNQAVQVTPKSALKPSSSSSVMPAIAKRPPIKHVDFAPTQLLQIKQKEDVNGKIVELGKIF